MNLRLAVSIVAFLLPAVAVVLVVVSFIIAIIIKLIYYIIVLSEKIHDYSKN